MVLGEAFGPLSRSSLTAIAGSKMSGKSDSGAGRGGEWREKRSAVEVQMKIKRQKAKGKSEKAYSRGWTECAEYAKT
jgi:hypothetical protein